MAFPRKPLLDRIIIREIPLKEIYEQGNVIVPLDDERFKQRSDRGEVMAIGDCVPMGGTILPMPVKVGDTVFFEDTVLSNPVYLKPSDKNDSTLPKYYMLRVGDLLGVGVDA